MPDVKLQYAVFFAENKVFPVSNNKKRCIHCIWNYKHTKLLVELNIQEIYSLSIKDVPFLTRWLFAIQWVDTGCLLYYYSNILGRFNEHFLYANIFCKQWSRKHVSISKSWEKLRIRIEKLKEELSNRCIQNPELFFEKI